MIADAVPVLRDFLLPAALVLLALCWLTFNIYGGDR